MAAGIVATMLGALLVCIYLFPLSVAMHRRCKATAGIVIVNIFLGWTFVGWVVALTWAAVGEQLPPQAQQLFVRKPATGKKSSDPFEGWTNPFGSRR